MKQYKISWVLMVGEVPCRTGFTTLWAGDKVGARRGFREMKPNSHNEKHKVTGVELIK